MVKSNRGTCPYCGSNRVYNGTTDEENGYMTQYSFCRLCHREFGEYFKLTYDGYFKYSEDGKLTCYDKDGKEI